MNDVTPVPCGSDLHFFSLELFEKQLGTQTIGKRVHYYRTVGSTNDVATQLALQGAEDGSLVVAEEQSQGRGRFGREWFSARGDGLYFSLILRPAVFSRHAPMLNLLAAVAVSQSLEQFCGVKVDIKWPNDILINQKKCCGILTEMDAVGEEVRFLVAGIGINVSHHQFPARLLSSSTSILLESGRLFSRESLLAVVLSHFEVLYQCFLREGGIAILDLWTERSSFARGKKVSIQLADRLVMGTTQGLSETGALRVVTDSGLTEEVLSGDVAIWE